MPRNGPEGQPRLNLERDLEIAAWAKALNLVPTVLHAHQKHDEGALVGLVLNRLDRNSFGARVTEMSDEIRRQLSQNDGIPESFDEAFALLEKKLIPASPLPKPEKPKARARKSKNEVTPLPRQMYLEQAHPEGYDRMWGRHPTHEAPGRRESVQDPEIGITKMHYRKRLYSNHIIFKDANYVWNAWWREFLKSIGYSQAEINARLHIRAEEAITRLQEAGLWYLVGKKGSWTPEEIRLLRSATRIDPYENV